MADVEKITIGNDTYDIRDASALHNTATGANSLTVAGTPTSNGNATQIGYNGYVEGYGATAYGYNTQAKKGYSIAIGYGSGVGLSAGTDGQYSIAIGYQAYTSADDAIQIGRGSNGNAHTLQVGFYNSGSPLIYKLLDSDGLIPTARQICTGAGAPTGTGVSGADIGRIYIDTTNKDAYICVDGQIIEGTNTMSYTWKQITA